MTFKQANDYIRSLWLDCDYEDEKRVFGIVRINNCICESCVHKRECVLPKHNDIIKCRFYDCSR